LSKGKSSKAYPSPYILDPIERLKQFKLKAKRIKEETAILLASTDHTNPMFPSLTEDTRKTENNTDVVYVWDSANLHPKEIQRMGTRRMASQESLPEIDCSLVPAQSRHFDFPRPKGLEPHVTLLVNNYVASKLMKGEVYSLEQQYGYRAA
jgi:hypothetical protein